MSMSSPTPPPAPLNPPRPQPLVPLSLVTHNRPPSSKISNSALPRNPKGLCVAKHLGTFSHQTEVYVALARPHLVKHKEHKPCRCFTGFTFSLHRTCPFHLLKEGAGKLYEQSVSRPRTNGWTVCICSSE